jgi:hypothetical protein
VQPTIHSWDGTTDAIIARIPISPYIVANAAQACYVTQIVQYDERRVLIGTKDGATASKTLASVWLLDIYSGQLTKLGPLSNLGETSGLGVSMSTDFKIGALTTFMGRVWMGPSVQSGGISLDLGYLGIEEQTWHGLDLGSNAGLSVNSMAVFKGNLYVATTAQGVAITANIYKITPSFAITAARTTTGTGVDNFFTSLQVSLDGTKLFAFMSDTNGPDMHILETTDGASWSTSYDVDANVSGDPQTSGTPFIDRAGNIFWPFASLGTSGDNDGALLKRTNAGVWSIISQGQTNISGQLALTRT